MADPDFWRERLRRFGHTGWADPAIYAYDQRLRLRAVARWLDERRRQPARALDFGCGVGDFCALLATHASQVVGYDIAPAILAAARARVALPGVRFTANRAEALAAGPYDAILCITVLQHVLADDLARRLADDLARALSPGGSLLMLETLAESPGPSAGHAHPRTESELRRLFEDAGLRFVERRPFHHPLQAPTPGFARYYRSPSVRLLRRLAAAGMGWAGRRLDAIAATAVARDEASTRAQSSAVPGAGPTCFLEFARPEEAPREHA